MLNNNCISDNINNIRQKVNRAALKAGANPKDITIIAVSKNVEINKMIEAQKDNIFDFGENRVQEFINKYDILYEKCRWHFIGRVQTNKVKYIYNKVDLIHSLDRYDLANEIQKRAEKTGDFVDTLVQVNVAGEASKAGLSVEEVKDFIIDVSKLPKFWIKGYKKVAPQSNNTEDVRWVFRKLKNIFIDINKENIDNISMHYLSMGMSNYYEVAIEEGANIVRIGSLLFGQRDYHKP